MENYYIVPSGYLPEIYPMLCLPRKEILRHHQMLRLLVGVTPQHQQMLRPPRKVRGFS